MEFGGVHGHQGCDAEAIFQVAWSHLTHAIWQAGSARPSSESTSGAHDSEYLAVFAAGGQCRLCSVRPVLTRKTGAFAAFSNDDFDAVKTCLHEGSQIEATAYNLTARPTVTGARSGTNRATAAAARASSTTSLAT